MNFLITSTYDRVSGMFGGPVLMKNEAHAKRTFNAMMEAVASDPKSYPKIVVEDTDLYVLGEFNPDTGVIIPETPRFVMRYSKEVK